MADVTILATGLGFPEGPVACADGSVVLTEIRNGRCSRVTPDGKVGIFSNCGGGPNGLAIGPDGCFYLCNNGGSRYVEGHSMGLGPHPDYKFGSVARIDPKTGEATLLYKEVGGHLLSAPNDLVFDKEGGFYFTDLGKRYPRHRDNGGVYYALPDGSSVIEVAYPILSPNGCGLSPDGKTLYVADIGAGKTFAYDIQPDGALKNRREFCAMGSDGMTLDSEGNVYLTGKGVIVFDKSGVKLATIEVPEPWTANVCFGGKDKQTLFITASTGFYGLKMRVKGAGSQ